MYQKKNTLNHHIFAAEFSSFFSPTNYFIHHAKIRVRWLNSESSPSRLHFFPNLKFAVHLEIRPWNGSPPYSPKLFFSFNQMLWENHHNWKGKNTYSNVDVVNFVGARHKSHTWYRFNSFQCIYNEVSLLWRIVHIQLICNGFIRPTILAWN